jgi:hypothetical protein
VLRESSNNNGEKEKNYVNENGETNGQETKTGPKEKETTVYPCWIGEGTQHTIRCDLIAIVDSRSAFLVLTLKRRICRTGSGASRKE